MGNKYFREYLEALDGEGMSFSTLPVIQDLIALAGKLYSQSIEVEKLYEVHADTGELIKSLSTLNSCALGEILDKYLREALTQIEGAYYRGFQDAISLTNHKASLLT